MGKVPLDDLNKGQLDAVTGPARHTLVLAGAGTGKTTVLTRRIAWMCADKGTPPNRVLAVTFTNKAASEMTERISSLMGGNVEGLWSGTFHSIGHRLLRHHTQAAGLHPQWSVIDSDDQTKLVKRVMELPRHAQSGLSAREAVEHINSRKDKGLRPPIGVQLEAPDAIYEDYQKLCEKMGAVDFGELLLRTKELLEGNDTIRTHYGKRFRHILVDEFQDTNRVQFELVETLAGPQSRIWAVGDDDQSIYAWRGAEPENMQLFRKKYCGESIVRLQDNYRSTGTVLSAANAVIKNNEDRIGKTLRAIKGQGDMIDLVVTDDVWGEARVISESAQQWMSQGHKADDVAVLCRTTAQMRVIEQVLVGDGIPYEVKGGTKFFEREEIRDVMAYMRLIRSTDDDMAFSRALNKPARGIGAKTADDIRGRADVTGESFWDAAKSMVEGDEQRLPARKSLVKFVALMDSLREDSQQMSVSEIAEACISRSGLKALYSAKSDLGSEMKVENLDEFVTACSEHGTLNELVDATALDAEGHPEGQPALQLMTMHSAKGLEFPMVVLAGMDDGTFPHPRSENENEERRLAYVGITRAKEKLILTQPKRRSYGGGGEDEALGPSKFIEEIPQDLLREDDRTARRRHDERWRNGRGRSQASWKKRRSSYRGRR